MADDRPFLQQLLEPADPDKLERFRQAEEILNFQKSNSLNRAQGNVRRGERILENLGIEAPQPQGESFIPRFFDALDTGGQMVRGVVASALNNPDYSGMSFLDAAIKGNKENLTVGKILADAGLKGSPLKDFTRGALGFVGDIATDPLTYVLPVSRGAGIKVGGRAISGEKIALKGAAKKKLGEKASVAELFKYRQEVNEAKALKNLDATLSKLPGNPAKEAIEAARANVIAKAKIEAEAPFGTLKGLQDHRKKLTRVGLDKTIEGLKAGDLNDSALRLQKVADELEVANLEDLDKIFAKPAIRGTSIFSGMGSAKVPLLNLPNYDIPGVTKASEQLFEKVSGAGYQAVYDVSKWLREAKTGSKGEVAEQAVKLLEPLGKALDGARAKTQSLAKLLSKRVAASGEVFGSNVYKEHINEAQAANGILMNQAISDASLVAGKYAGNKEFAEGITNFLESGIQRKQSRRLAEAMQRRDAAQGLRDIYSELGNKNMTSKLDRRLSRLDRTIEHMQSPNFKVKPGDILEEQSLLQQAEENLRNHFNSVKPGMGDDAVKVARYIRDDMAEMAQVETKYGLYDSVIDGYVHHMYDMGDEGLLSAAKLTPEQALANKNHIREHMSKNPGRMGFTLERSLASLAEAEGLGYRANRNIFDIYIARKYWHHRALNEMKFMERMQLMYALKPEAYEALRHMTRSSNLEARGEARAVLSRLGFNADVSDLSNVDIDTRIATKEGEGAKIEKSLHDTLFKPKFTQDGKLLSLQEYEDLKAGIASSDPNIATKARERASGLGLAIADQNATAKALDIEALKIRQDNESPLRFFQRMANGNRLTPKQYQRMYDSVNGKIGVSGIVDSPVKDGILKQAGDLGFTLSPEKYEAEMARVASDDLKFLEAAGDLIDRDGESIFAKSGATTISDKLFQVAGDKMTQDEKLFWRGLVPNSMAEVVEDSLRTSSALADRASKLSRQNADPMADALYSAQKFYHGWLRLLKLGATVPWPGYHARNISGAQFQGASGAAILPTIYHGIIDPLAQAASSKIGKYLGLESLAENYEVLARGKNFLSVTGERLSKEKLLGEMRQIGLKTSLEDTIDLVTMHSDAFEGMARSAVKLDTPGARELLAQYDEAAKNKKFYNKAWDKIKSFSEGIENFSRSQLYMQLRKDGYGVQSAANEVNRLLIDYGRGKTRFERDVLAKNFFFYSFSRGQATNTFVSLLNRPSALTGQLHAFNAVAEVFTNPDNLEEVENLDDAMLSVRKQRGLTRVVGKGESGLAQYLTGVGLPAEDIMKLMTVKAPSKFTVGEVIRAFEGTAKDTMTSLLAQTNPIIKGIIETTTGHNLFFDRPITDETLRKIPMWERDTNILVGVPFRAVPSAVWDGLDAVTREVLDGRANGDGTMTINPNRMAFLVQIVPGLSRFYSTKMKMSDPALGALEKYTQFLTGVKIYEADPAKSSAYERAAQLKEFFEERGIPSSLTKAEKIKRLTSGTE